MSHFKLRDYQQSVVNAALNHVKYRRGVHGFCVAPGGSGKSVMIAKLAEAIYDNNPKQQIIILARNEKLLTQNMAKLSPDHQMQSGIYCAGLGSKELDKPITIASVQSIAGAEHHFSGAVVLLDECHNATNETDDDTQFWAFIRSIPDAKVIGFTATPYRQKGGKLTWGDEIISVPLKPLFRAGYLVPPTNKAPVSPDLEQIPIKMGEFVKSKLEEVFTEPELLAASVEAILRYLPNRKCCVVFTQTRKHSEILLEALADNGLPRDGMKCVDGETDKKELSAILNNWADRNHPLKVVINCQLLKEGVDVPEIDMVVSLRSTISKTLWAQILYRGSRPAKDKKDFLVLDMGGNFMRLGGLGSPYMEQGTKEARRETGRICPSCETFVSGVAATECPDCGFVFPPPENRHVAHEHDPDNKSATYYDEETAIAWHNVNYVSYAMHQKRTDPSKKSLRVDFDCEYKRYSMYLSPFHDNDWVQGKFTQYFVDGGGPADILRVLGMMKRDEAWKAILIEAEKLTPPTRIKVDDSGKYPDIKRLDYAKEKCGSSDTAGSGELLEDDYIPF